MSQARTTPPSINGFRLSAYALAGILGGLATWVLAAEIVRPKGIEFTTDAQFAALNYARRDAAVTAARVGLVRGDLWSEAAFAYGDLLLSKERNLSSPDAAVLERTRALTELAISYAPHDSAVWLLLAAIYLRSDSVERSSTALKMSYYTGSNTVAILPQRLLLAMLSHALQDAEFQELVRHDVRIAVTHKSNLMPALVAAYKSAPPSGRQFIEKTLAEFDPGILASVRAEGDH